MPRASRPPSRQPIRPPSKSFPMGEPGNHPAHGAFEPAGEPAPHARLFLGRHRCESGVDIVSPRAAAGRMQRPRALFFRVGERERLPGWAAVVGGRRRPTGRGLTRAPVHMPGRSATLLPCLSDLCHGGPIPPQNCPCADCVSYCRARRARARPPLTHRNTKPARSIAE